MDNVVEFTPPVAPADTDVSPVETETTLETAHIDLEYLRPVPFTADDRRILMRIDALLDAIEPLIETLPAMMESFGQSPVAKMLGLR